MSKPSATFPSTDLTADIAELEQEIQKAIYGVLITFRKRTGMTARHRRRLVRRIGEAIKQILDVPTPSFAYFLEEPWKQQSRSLADLTT